jgi:phosphoribosyl 1,2-cyclic phosphate phosphodiesterase
MLRHKVWSVDSVVYTHNHADHVFGIDDLRRFNAVTGRTIDIHAEPRMIQWLGETFRYIFDSKHNINQSFVPQLATMPIELGRPFDVAGRPWTPFRLLHGRLPIVGFRVGGLAYCTDCSAIPPETWRHLEGLDTLVIDALRYTHHPTHFTVDQALEVVEQVQPRMTYFTHIAHEIGHADLESRLPDHVRLAYDGLEIDVND